MDTKPISAQLCLLITSNFTNPVDRLEQKNYRNAKTLTSCGASYELHTTKGQPHLTRTFYQWFFHCVSEIFPSSAEETRLTTTCPTLN